MMRRALLIVGGLAIVVVSFFVGLNVSDYYDRQSDVTRIENAKSILAALEKYHSAKGTYPVHPAKDVRVAELAGPLVSGKYISAIPYDLRGADPIRYASFDGNSFGLSISFATMGPCKIVVGAPSSGWWGDQPTCQFK